MTTFLKIFLLLLLGITGSCAGREQSRVSRSEKTMVAVSTHEAIRTNVGKVPHVGQLSQSECILHSIRQTFGTGLFPGRAHIQSNTSDSQKIVVDVFQRISAAADPGGASKETLAFQEVFEVDGESGWKLSHKVGSVPREGRYSIECAAAAFVACAHLIKLGDLPKDFELEVIPPSGDPKNREVTVMVSQFPPVFGGHVSLIVGPRLQVVRKVPGH